MSYKNNFKIFKSGLKVNCRRNCKKIFWKNLILNRNELKKDLYNF